MRIQGHMALGAVLAALCVVPVAAQLSTPQAIRMQGYLSDKSSGTPVPANGSYTMQFDLYDGLLSGGLVASSGPLSVLVSGGLYEVELPFTADNYVGTERYIEIAIDPDGAGPQPSETLSPRVKVVSAPYAYVAEKLDGLESTAFAVKVHTHAGSDITTGTIAEGMIDAAIARDSEIMPTVAANGGHGKGIDADKLDGIEAAAFLTTGSGWSMTGNAGTVPGAHFLGTTDSVNLEFRVEGQRVLLLTTPHWSPNVVGGSSSNSVAAGVNAQTIAGGGEPLNPNQVLWAFGTVGGGVGNVANNSSTVAGGVQNKALASESVIGGGTANQTIEHPHSTIGGGYSNVTHNYGATIGGGRENSATGILSTIGGGKNNRAWGIYSTVPGGQDNEALGTGSLAAGQHASAAHEGSFVWADSTDATISTTWWNQFVVRASGGTFFYSDAAATTGVTLAPGSGAWSTVSDLNLKNAFSALDPVDILNRLARLPVQTWSYNSQDPSVRHIGPTAQDFASLFGVGENNRSISTVDADGVALAGIQGLYRLVQEKDLEIEQLKRRLEELEARMSAMGDGR